MSNAKSTVISIGFLKDSNNPSLADESCNVAHCDTTSPGRTCSCTRINSSRSGRSVVSRMTNGMSRPSPIALVDIAASATIGTGSSLKIRNVLLVPRCLNIIANFPYDEQLHARFSSMGIHKCHQQALNLSPIQYSVLYGKKTPT